MTTQQAALIGGSGREITFAQAINEALAEEMRRDPRVFIIGEDVAEAGTPFEQVAELLWSGYLPEGADARIPWPRIAIMRCCRSRSPWWSWTGRRRRPSACRRRA